MKAEFTIFMDHDGYWVADKSEADAIIAAPELYRGAATKARTKIAACRMALEKAQDLGATELHLGGVGATIAIKTEARKVGIKPFVYIPDKMTDLTSEWAHRRVVQKAMD